MPDRFLQDIVSNLEFHTSWVAIDHQFIKNRPHGEEASFIRRMLETEKAMIHLLSRVLRQQDYAPASVQPDSKLLDLAKRRHTSEAMLGYIHHGILSSLAWYQARLAIQEHPFHDLLQTLFDMETGLLQDIEHVMGVKASS